MKILFLSAWFPFPPNNGARLRIYNLLRGLSAQHSVTLITVADPGVTEAPAELKSICQEVYLFPDRPYNARSLRSLLGFFSPIPRVLVDRYQPAMADRIQRETASGTYDLVIASQWYTAAYARHFNGTPAIFEEAEMGVFYDKVTHTGSPLKQFRHRLTNLKMASYFQHLLKDFAACTVASSQERNLMDEMVPGYDSIHVIPNGVRVSEYRDVREKVYGDTLIFTGSFRYFANYEGIRWFLQHVYPIVQEEIPSVRLTITGDHAGRPLPAVRNVILTGYVKDVRPLIASSWASIVPLLTGGGTRLKILEAMALRTPVVATSKGAEGLDGLPGEHLLVADRPEDFADATIQLLKDARLRRRLSENASKLVRERYDWNVILPAFLKLAENAAGTQGGISGIHPHIQQEAVETEAP